MDKRFGTTARKEKDTPLNISEKGGVGITAAKQAIGRCKKCGGKLDLFAQADDDSWGERILDFLVFGYENGTVVYRKCKSCGEKDHYQNEYDKKLVMLILAAAWVLNDPRMLDAGNLSYEAVYKDREDNNFCSVSDSIRDRKDSACKNLTYGCLSGGKDCPIFEKYKSLSESELRDFYVNKVKNG
jgi:hypothetical protein